ncbi:MAG: transcriptional repressor [Bacteroidales bacterium]|nr:transcriptional repressor [Bacteroidales bacterium]
MSLSEWKEKLVVNGLRVTPQRMAVLEAFSKLDEHPTAESIISFVREHHPNIATGTVYKILEILVEKKIIIKVKTDRDFVRYDAITENHHHLYSDESEQIEDYFDKDLDSMLMDYFRKKNIPGFEIEDIKLQIRGKFS